MVADIETLLREAGLLEGMDARAADALLGRIAVQTYEAGAFLINEGEIGDAAYVLLAGSVQVLGTRPDGSWIALARLEPVSLFGEQALLGRAGGRRAATVRAITPVTVARLGAQEFQEALPARHSLRRRLIRLGEEQLRERLSMQSSLFRALFPPKAPGDESGGLGAELRTFERGKALFYQGQPSDAVYIVVSGVAGIYIEKNNIPQLVARAEAGRYLGERGLLRREPHTTTVIAEETVTAFRIPGERFLDLHARSPELREHLESLESIYELPRRGFVTQFAGTFQERECLTSVYHLPGGRRAVASHVPSEELTHLAVHGAEGDAEHAVAAIYRFEDPSLDIEREIAVSASGSLVSLTARGEWSELPELFVLALDGGTLAPWQCDAFAETGSIALEAPPTFNADDEIICACMRVRRREVRAAILEGCNTVSAIRDRCRAGGACGACKPRLREMLGKSAWTPARIIHEADIASGVRVFRLTPLKGAARPARAGQHIVLQAQIDGRWVERPYTLSAPTSAGYYEITVKRIPQGLFSSWLFDRRGSDALIRVSEPQGDFTLPEGEAPVVFLVAGIGVTPAIAAARAMIAKGGGSRVHIDYSAQRPENAAYAAEIEAANSACAGLTTLVRYTKKSGRIGDTDIVSITTAHPGAIFLLCGPNSFLAGIRARLQSKGIAADRIRSEEFVFAGENAPPTSVALSLHRFAQAPPSLRVPGSPLVPPSLSAPMSAAAPVSTHVPTSRSGAFSQAAPGGEPLSETGRHTMIPSTTRAGQGLIGGGYAASMPNEGVCPFAHGTYRDDGIGLVPPIVAGAQSSVTEEARAFLAQLYREKGAPKAFFARFSQVAREIERTGTYKHTYDELSFGAKLAWRNSTRCIGRFFWNGLQVRDLRHLTSEEDMLKAMIEHIELATNGGNLRSMMTVFAPADKDGKGPRIWNSQLFRYAGYRLPNGSVLGDPMNADLTDQALRLGWRPAQRTRFDLLPLIISLPGREPKWMEIPRGIVREIMITHPDYPFFMDLGLKWYALPAVSDVLFDVGGVKYTAAPFNGWYMGTEIGARNFTDEGRYNLLPEIAERLGLDTRRSATLWRDRAQLELTRAVVYSFERAGVKLVDHHAAAEDFIQFIEAEGAVGRCVHMTWNWIVPPMGGSVTRVFHLDQDRYPDVPLKPNFFYQPRAFGEGSG